MSESRWVRLESLSGCGPGSGRSAWFVPSVSSALSSSNKAGLQSCRLSPTEGASPRESWGGDPPR